MSFIKNNKGNSLIEILVVAGVMMLIMISCMSMLVYSMRSFEGTTMQVYSDMDATLAMQKIVNDIREAKSYTFLANGKQLQLTYPAKFPQGYYNRKEADTTDQIDYYLSDKHGNAGTKGKKLWRKKSNGSKAPIADNIADIQFVEDTKTRSIQVTVDAENQGSGSAKTTQLTQRVVYLRNN